MVGLNMNGPARDRVMKLIEEKDRIEAQIREQTAVLVSNSVGMDDPLVDDQGYPRGDIDVYKVRHARHAIICLQNDHKALMKHIERGLTEVHSEFRTGGSPSSVSAPTTSSNGHAPNGVGDSSEVYSFGEHDRGFAVISFVHNGSPADIAGLCERDEVLKFGSVTPENFRDVSQILDVVAHSVGQNIQVLVRRNRLILNLTVTPKPWSQPGLLGCQIQRRS